MTQLDTSASRPHADSALAPTATASVPPAGAAPAATPAATRPRASRYTRRGMVLLGLMILIRLVSVAGVLSTHPDDYYSILGGDARRYDDIVLSEGTPYKDFKVEYPPVVVGFVHLTHGGTLFESQIRLALSQLAVDLAIAGLLAWAWNRKTGLAYLLIGAPFMAFPYIYMRVDLLPVLFATLGFALVRKGWQAAGGVSLAVGVFAKLWPFFVAPLLIVERKWKGLAAWAVAGLAGAAAWVAWVGSTDGIMQVVSFRGSKGWQVESLYGIFVHMGHPANTHIEGGAWRNGIMQPWARPLLTISSLVCVALAWWWAERRRREGAHDAVVYGLAPLMCVLGLLVFAPILSPQYLLWVLPFSAVLAARGEKLLTWLSVATIAVTTYSFAVIHAQTSGRLYATVPVVIRNGLLVVMLVIAGLQLLGKLKSPAIEPTDDDPGLPWEGATAAAPDDGEPATASLGV
jgi:hypothetical protein